MEFDVEIKNYRCFTDEKPARIRFRPGFTALIGPNNVGKSALLKALYDVRGAAESLARQNGLGAALGRAGMFQTRAHVFPERHDRAFTRLNDRPLALGVRLPAVPRRRGTPEVDALTIELPRFAHASVATTITANGRDIRDDRQVTGPGEDGILWTSESRKLATAGLLHAALSDLSRCMFIGPFRNALNLEPKEPYYDIDVGTAFIGAWSRLKTVPDAARNAAAHRVADDIRRIFGFRSLDINASEDRKTLMVYRNGVAHTLDELGSGLAQFILTLANAAMRQPSYILVDEPELNLHPSLQIDFLTTLASYAERGIIFATHSLGLARAVGDAIYSVHQGPDGVSEMDFDGDVRLPELLGEMCYAGYRDLGWKTVLLVEGPTDIKTMQQFLRKLGKDHQIVYLSLGGSDMINGKRAHELAEVTRIAERVVAVIDSERPSKESPPRKDRQAFLRLCKRLGIHCHVLDRRAVENYLSDRAVKLVKGEHLRTLLAHEKLSPAKHGWAKTENWRIAREMQADDLKGTDLGEILESL